MTEAEIYESKKIKKQSLCYIQAEKKTWYEWKAQDFNITNNWTYHDILIKKWTMENNEQQIWEILICRMHRKGKNIRKARSGNWIKRSSLWFKKEKDH